MKYCIIEMLSDNASYIDKSAAEFEKLVGKAVEREGWVPVGGVCVVSVPQGLRFYQSCTKPTGFVA